MLGPTYLQFISENFSKKVGIFFTNRCLVFTVRLITRINSWLKRAKNTYFHHSYISLSLYV